MQKLILLSSCALVLSAASNPVAAKQVADASGGKASCDAKYFDYLVGKGLDQARSIGDVDYRVLPDGADPGAPQPKRMTIKVDGKNRITEVSCG